MGYVPPTPIESYPPMPCDELIPTNIMGDVILYADNKVVASYSTITKERDIPKPKICNCPNCGAPVNGPICEYCGSVLDQAEIDRQKRELAEKQRHYEQLFRQWQQVQTKQEQIEDLSFSKVVIILVSIIFVLLAAVQFAAFLA